jgi:hypothetical protein
MFVLLRITQYPVLVAPMGDYSIHTLVAQWVITQYLAMAAQRVIRANPLGAKLITS